LISFRFVFVDFVSFRFCWFRFVSFRFRWFRFVSISFRERGHKNLWCWLSTKIKNIEFRLRQLIFRTMHASDMNSNWKQKVRSTHKFTFPPFSGTPRLGLFKLRSEPEIPNLKTWNPEFLNLKKYNTDFPKSEFLDPEFPSLNRPNLGVPELPVMYARSTVTDKHARWAIINQNYCIKNRIIFCLFLYFVLFSFVNFFYYVCP
jgi:hypothetical protein